MTPHILYVCYLMRFEHVSSNEKEEEKKKHRVHHKHRRKYEKIKSKAIEKKEEELVDNQKLNS